MEWRDVKDAPIHTEVLISIRWADVPVIAWLSGSGCWYSSKGHIIIDGDASAYDDFQFDEVEGWMPIPKPKWKLEQETK